MIVGLVRPDAGRVLLDEARYFAAADVSAGRGNVHRDQSISAAGQPSVFQEAYGGGQHP